MRTTITIDDELYEQLRAEAARTGRRICDVLNERLRLGLSIDGPDMRSTKFVVHPFDTTRFALGVEEKKLNQVLDSVETKEL